MVRLRQAQVGSERDTHTGIVDILTFVLVPTVCSRQASVRVACLRSEAGAKYFLFEARIFSRNFPDISEPLFCSPCRKRGEAKGERQKGDQKRQRKVTKWLPKDDRNRKSDLPPFAYPLLRDVDLWVRKNPEQIISHNNSLPSKKFTDELLQERREKLLGNHLQMQCACRTL